MTAKSMPRLRSGLLARVLLALAACAGVPLTTAGAAYAHHRPDHVGGPTTAPTTAPPTTTATTRPPTTTVTTSPPPTSPPTTTAPATTTTLPATTTPTTAGATSPAPATTAPATTVTTTGGTTATTMGETTTATTGTAPSSSGTATDLGAATGPSTSTATGGETRVLSARSGFRADVVRPAVDRRELANRLTPSSGATSTSPDAPSEGPAPGDEVADAEPAPAVAPPEPVVVNRPLALGGAGEHIDASDPAASTGRSGLGAMTLLAIGAVLALAAGFVVLDNRGWGWWPWVADAGPDEAGG